MILPISKNSKSFRLTTDYKLWVERLRCYDAEISVGKKNRPYIHQELGFSGNMKSSNVVGQRIKAASQVIDNPFLFFSKLG